MRALNYVIKLVKLKKWEDVHKALFRRHIPRIISARELLVFRQFERIFSGIRLDVEAHQCLNCGQLFVITKERTESVKKDFAGNPVCPKCAKSVEHCEDLEWRQKFELFRKLTEAIRALERSSPEEAGDAERRVRDLTQDTFEFRDMKELYLKYFELMNELGAQQDRISKIKSDRRSFIEGLFERGKKRNTIEFIRFIFSTDPNETRQIAETIWQSNLLVIRMEKDYFLSKISEYPLLINPISKDDLAESRLRARLLLYCHLIEMNALYNLSMNLAIVARGEKFQSKPFPTRVRYPWKKIELIEKQNPELSAILKGFYCREVRNAFAHSKYRIAGNYFIKTDEDFRISIEDLQEKIDLLNAYWEFLYYKIAEEQVKAMKEGIIETRDGDTVKISVGRREKYR